MMSFAATVHKCQGLTLRKAMVCLERMFNPAQAFVAFSRVTNMKGLVLIGFEKSKIYCDVRALAVCAYLKV